MNSSWLLYTTEWISLLFLSILEILTRYLFFFPLCFSVMWLKVWVFTYTCRYTYRHRCTYAYRYECWPQPRWSIGPRRRRVRCSAVFAGTHARRFSKPKFWNSELPGSNAFLSFPLLKNLLFQSRVHRSFTGGPAQVIKFISGLGLLNALVGQGILRHIYHQFFLVALYDRMDFLIEIIVFSFVFLKLWSNIFNFPLCF